MSNDQITNASIINFIERDGKRWAALVTVDGEQGVLHRRNALGATYEDRQASLCQLAVGDSVPVVIVGSTKVDGADYLRVSQYKAEQHKWLQKVEPWIAHGQVFKADVNRVEHDKGFVIVSLPEEVEGLLHFTNAAGATDDEKLSRLQSLQVGDCIHTFVIEARRPGRVRVREFAA